MARIKLLVVALFAVALVGCGGGSADSREPKKDALPSYEQWQTDVKKVTDPAIPWLQNRLNQDGKKLAVVFDIDNTALETHYRPGQANMPVLGVAQWAETHNVSVLFVTLRDEKDRDSTMTQLQRAGYAVDGLCMRTTGERTKPTCREKLTAEGYTITANIGNRSTDFDGDSYERAFRLPDYDGKLQ